MQPYQLYKLSCRPARPPSYVCRPRIKQALQSTTVLQGNAGAVTMFFVFNGGPELLPFDAAKKTQFAEALARSLVLEKPYPPSNIKVALVSATPKAAVAHHGNATTTLKQQKVTRLCRWALPIR